MVKKYTKKIAIANTCTAISNISSSWAECWENLLAGKVIFEEGDDIAAHWPKTAPLSMLGEKAGWSTQPPYLIRFKTLAEEIVSAMRPQVEDLVKRHKDIRLAAIVGTCHSDPGALTTFVNTFAPNDSGATESSQVDKRMWDMFFKTGMTSYINEALGFPIPVSYVSTACASALVATSYAADMINIGMYDAVLIIGIDTMSRVAAAGFYNIGAMAKNGLCTPYDKDRAGTIVGEGAASYLLVNKDLLPDDQTFGYVSGTAVYCDAAHMVEPNLEGVRCVLQDAIGQAEVTPSDIAGIYWHGTGTKHNDKIESEASQLLFGELSPPCTSTKGSLGHTMGASGAYNILAACESNKTGLMSHVATLKNLEYPNLDVVQGAPRQIKPGPILVTALGFGGINAAIVITPSA